MKLKLTVSTFILGLVLTAIGLLFLILTGCTHVKKTTDKKEQQIEQGSTTKIEYRTNTIYTDTGSVTTYYRDSLIFSHDTVIQPIEKVVSRWFKQEVKHDSFYINKKDTVTITIREKATEKQKASFPWFWVIVLGAIGVIGFAAKTVIK